MILWFDKIRGVCKTHVLKIMGSKPNENPWSWQFSEAFRSSVIRSMPGCPLHRARQIIASWILHPKEDSRVIVAVHISGDAECPELACRTETCSRSRLQWKQLCGPSFMTVFMVSAVTVMGRDAVSSSRPAHVRQLPPRSLGFWRKAMPSTSEIICLSRNSFWCAYGPW